MDIRVFNPSDMHKYKMAFWIFYVLASITVKHVIADFLSKNADNYGLYDVEWEHFDVCRGPKQLTFFNCTTKLIKEGNGSYKGEANVTIFEDSHIDEIRLSVYTIKENKKTLLWNYIVNKPCQHYMLSSLLENYGKVKNCWIKKGTYNLSFPLTDLMRNYMGNSFFYGDYLFKAVGTSKKANLICYIFDPKFKKQVKN